jgi:hypothetical protein
VARNDGLLAAQVLDHGGDVGDQQRHVIVVHALRFAGQIVAALVDRDGLVAKNVRSSARTSSVVTMEGRWGAESKADARLWEASPGVVSEIQ